MKVLLILVAIDAQVPKHTLNGAKCLIASAVRTLLDADVLLVHNQKENQYRSDYHRLVEYTPSFPDFNETICGSAAQRLRPKLLASVETDQYDAVLLLDVDTIFLQKLDLSSLDLATIYSACVTVYDNSSSSKIFSPSFALIPAVHFKELMLKWWTETLLMDEKGETRPEVWGWDSAVKQFGCVQTISPHIFRSESDTMNKFFRSSILHLGPAFECETKRFAGGPNWEVRRRLQLGLFMGRFCANACDEIFNLLSH